MTGRELLEAMSYVDEKYVEEAENAVISRFSRLNFRRVATLAACLCVVLAGVSFLIHFQGWNTFKATSDNCAENGSALPPEDAELSASQNLDETMACVTQKQASLILRVEEVTDTGFTATVARAGGNDAFPVGTTLQVIWNENTRESCGSKEYACDTALLEGTLVQVDVLSFDAETGTVTAQCVKLLEDPEE